MLTLKLSQKLAVMLFGSWGNSFFTRLAPAAADPQGPDHRQPNGLGFFRKIGEPKKQHGTPRDMICHCITKVGRREHGKWVSIFL